MSAQHTPGPWQVNHSNPHQVCDCDGEKRGCSPIASTHAAGDPAGTAAANARLIAAAPDLLEHMLAVASYANAPHVDSTKALAFIRETAIAAIAKATGRKL